MLQHRGCTENCLCKQGNGPLVLLCCTTQHFRISKINAHDTHALAAKRVQDQGGTSQIVDPVPPGGGGGGGALV